MFSSMNRNIILILTLVINSCITSTGIEKKQSAVSETGWTKNVGSFNSNNELFFMRKQSEASEVAKQKKSGSMMQESCMASAKESIKPDLISELSKSLVPDSDLNPKQISLIESSISNVNTSECKAIAERDEKIPFSEWRACDCVFYAKINGGKDSLLSKINEL